MASDNNQNNEVGIAKGGAIIAVAGIFDAIQAFLAFTIVGYLIIWVVSLQAYLLFSIWLALMGAYSLERGMALCIPFAGGCVGAPMWTGAIWTIVARTVAAEKLNKLAPGAGAVASKVLK